MTRWLVGLVLVQATFFTRTDLVVVPVTVTDRGGRPVGALTQEQFKLFEDGKEQMIVRFDHGNVPLTLGLVVDCSLSMRPKVARVVAALSTFAAAGRSSDEMFVLRFNNLLSFDPEGERFTGDARELLAGLSSMSPAGGTALYDALIEGLRKVSLGTRDRKALLVISDGGDNSSGQTFGQVLALAQQSQAAIYAIGVGSNDDKADRKNARMLGELAERSGGRAYFPSSIDAMTEILDRITNDLRDQYVLAFAPADAGRKNVHSIRVVVSGTNLGRLDVRSRTSYSREPERDISR